MTTETTKPTSIKGDLRRLERAVNALEQMQPDERQRAFNWLKSKFSKEWPYEPN